MTVAKRAASKGSKTKKHPPAKKNLKRAVRVRDGAATANATAKRGDNGESSKRRAELTREQAALLKEALTRGGKTENAMEADLVAFGNWILTHVFDGDVDAALDHKSGQAVWRELLGRAGSSELKISRRLLYVGLHIAAQDKRIHDDVWKKLDPGRKELLLPLGDDTAMKKAAHYVEQEGLSQRATRTYVRSLLAKKGRPAAIRMSKARAKQTISKLVGTFSNDDYREKLIEQVRELPRVEQQQVRKQLERLQQAVSEIMRSAKS